MQKLRPGQFSVLSDDAVYLHSVPFTKAGGLFQGKNRIKEGVGFF